MPEKLVFELHEVNLATEELDSSPADTVETVERDRVEWWRRPAIQPKPAVMPLPLTDRQDRIFWAQVDAESGNLRRVENPEEATIAFCLLRQQLSSHLALATLIEGLLINGLPALPFSILAPRDTVRLTPNHFFYVTERYTPHVGAPPAEMLGRKCPFCGIPVDAKSHIVSCRCGVVYHYETAETHPELPVDDRLNCFEKVKNCLSCSHILTAEEYLTWDLETL